MLHQLTNYKTNTYPWTSTSSIAPNLSDPIKLCVVDLLTKGDKSFSNLSKVVSDHLSLYRSEGYHVNSVFTDNEPSMIALRHVIQGAGARHVTGGVKSNNLAKIDRQIRLKDRVRSILHSLPYSLPRKLIPWAVYFAVSRINLLNHSFYKPNQPSPRELFSGGKSRFQERLTCFLRVLPSIN
jgi:hypothetical protein